MQYSFVSLVGQLIRLSPEAIRLESHKDSQLELFLGRSKETSFRGRDRVLPTQKLKISKTIKAACLVYTCQIRLGHVIWQDSLSRNPHVVDVPVVHAVWRLPVVHLCELVAGVRMKIKL